MEDQIIDNCIIAEIILQDGVVQHADDNVNDLLTRFSLRVNREGWMWICRKCGKPAYSSEIWFDCKQCFVTVRVVCHLGCHSRWTLEIACKNDDCKKQ